MSDFQARVPLYLYVLAGRVTPTTEQARLLTTKEWYGGPLDGLAVQMPNVVDWSRSEVDLSPLIPWLGNPDPTWPRRLARKLTTKWLELKGQLEVIRLEVEIIGDGYKWGELYPVRALKHVAVSGSVSEGQGDKSMKVFKYGEVTDPKDLLLSPDDKLLGYLIRGTYEDDYLLCIATKDAAAYYGDEDWRGMSELLIYNSGSTAVYSTFNKDIAKIADSLASLQEKVGLNSFELNELFGHDGPSSDLVGHISKLVAALPPNADECRTARHANSCTISQTHRLFANIVSRYGNGKPMRVRISDGDMVAWQTTTEKILEMLNGLDPADQWVIHTGDGHMNPVIRIAPIRSRASGKYAIGVWFDSMLEYASDE